MRSNYPQMQRWIGLSEGGFIDHPDDPGGATDRGITQATFDAWRRRLGEPLEPVRGISKAEAERIIAFQYLDRVGADELPAGLDYAVADFAVNSGVSRAARELQRVLGVTVDGVVGVQTLAAANRLSAQGVEEVIIALCEGRMAFLKRLRHWGTFGRGWTRRVMGERPGIQHRDNGVIDRAVMLARATRSTTVNNVVPGPVRAGQGKGDPAARSCALTQLFRRPA